VLQILATVYGVIWLATAIAPVNRFDWFLENLLVFAFVGLLAATYRAFPLSDLSYTLIAVFLSLHAVGAHYTYSESPMGVWLQEAWDLERNHYDRLVHFVFGLLFCYPLRETILRGTGEPPRAATSWIGATRAAGSTAPSTSPIPAPKTWRGPAGSAFPPVATS
jgi:uncharacterized membrane protein YjdF